MERQKLHQHKRPISINNIVINKIALSNKASFTKKGFIYFIGYKGAKNLRPLGNIFPKMSTYRKNFDETKCTSFLIKDDVLLEKI